MMTVRNNDELKLFLDTIDQCEEVILITPDRMEYNLNDLRERFIGLGKVMSSEESPELEVYARNREDVAKLFRLDFIVLAVSSALLVLFKVLEKVLWQNC